MHQGQEIHRGSRAPVFRERLIFGVVKPALGGLCGRELEQDQAARRRIGTLEGLALVVEVKELTAVLLENREEPLLVFAVGVGVFDGEVGDHEGR